MRNRRYYAAHRAEKISRYVAARRERLKARKTKPRKRRYGVNRAR